MGLIVLAVIDTTQEVLIDFRTNIFGLHWSEMDLQFFNTRTLFFVRPVYTTVHPVYCCQSIKSKKQIVYNGQTVITYIVNKY